MIILIIIVVIIAIPLIGALFVSKELSAVREITINKPKEEVYNYLLLLKNHNKFSKWAVLDPNMETEFRGTDGTVGFVSTWNSTNKDVGKGEQEIIKIAPGERIDYELRFLKPFKSTNYAFISTETLTSSQTIVKWGFNGQMTYPFNFMRLFMNINDKIGNDFSIGLNNLKGILEK